MRDVPKIFFDIQTVTRSDNDAVFHGNKRYFAGGDGGVNFETEHPVFGKGGRGVRGFISVEIEQFYFELFNVWIDIQIDYFPGNNGFLALVCFLPPGKYGRHSVLFLPLAGRENKGEEEEEEEDCFGFIIIQ